MTSVQTSYTDGAAILRRKSMIQTQRFDDIHAVMASVSNMGHLDLLASFTHQQALLGSSELLLGDGHEEFSDLQRQREDGVPSPFQPPGRDFPAYDVVGKSQAYGASFRKKPELSAIKEQPEDSHAPLAQAAAHSQGRGSSNYISVRQSLLQALIATQYAGRMSAQHRAREQGSLQTEAGNVGALRAAQPRQGTDRGVEDEEGSSFNEAQHPSPLPQRSTQAQKTVQAADTTQPLTPKSKRKRHNSERVPGHRQGGSELRGDISKSLEFLPDKGKRSPQQSEELQPLQLGSDAKSAGGLTARASVTQMLSGRQLTKVQPKLPSPDVFTISRQHPPAD